MQPDPIDPRLITVGVAILIIVLIGIGLYVHRRRVTTTELRRRFGSEYERTVREHGSVNKAQKKLEDREARVDRLNIRTLGATERERFVADWRAITLCRPAKERGHRSRPAGLLADAGAWLSIGRFRSAGGGHLGQPSSAHGRLPLCARGRHPRWQQRDEHGRSADRNAAIPDPFR
jgi:hypothetical protein